ncbi:MAG: cytochrome c biosis protein CcsA [Verrucomicrobiota bacterium]|jgi:ABC-type transport system involved in cytochrome c biogenesis permease subunit
MSGMKPMLWTRITASAILATMLISLFVLMVIDMNPKTELSKVDGYQPWEKECVDLVNRLPVQDGGRVKPFSTHAQFTMLRMRGDRKIKVENETGQKFSIKPSEWMMDCLFRPTLAVKMPTFRVDNSAAIEAIGLKALGLRDRYSYQQLEDGIPKLFELAQSYEKIEEKRRDAVQKQVMDLAYNVRNYQFLIGYFGFARAAVEMKNANPDGSSRFTDMSTVMGTAPMISQMVQQSQSTGQAIPPNLQALLQQVLDGANFAKFGLVLLPPEDKASSDWRSVGDRIMDVMTGKVAEPREAIEEVKLLETAVRSVPISQAEFRKQFEPFVQKMVKRATERGEYRSIAAENHYNRKSYILYAMVFFLFGLILAGAYWFLKIFEMPRWVMKATSAASWINTALGLLAMCTAIGMRCYIMWRPPVGNLYDTIIFICAVAVLLLLVIEYFTREALAHSLAALMGLALVLLARRFEVGDAKDHMDPLVAVLNSNYWLTTHVITITMGYAAGLLTAFLSMTYVLLYGLGLGDNLKKILKMVTTAAYGGLCLTLFLSLVGTVLGGIWANDSWGRFWGWDPKENGALMIVLWSLILLHARFGGIVKEWGFHLGSIFLASIVSFSWWHVNFLGQGLHNYGFTSGKSVIWFFYLAVVLTILFGIVLWVVEQAQQMPQEKTKHPIA